MGKMTMDDSSDAPRGALQIGRVAVAVFDNLSAIERAVDGFLSAGIEPSQMVLVAGNADEQNSLAHALIGHGNSLTFREIPIRGRKAATSSSGGADRSAFRGPDLLGTPFETWGTPSTAHNLQTHLDHGGCALIAAVDKPERERQVLAILLANSIDQVQLHDVILEGQPVPDTGR